MICIGPGSDLMVQLLSNGRWRLVPIPNAIQIGLKHPTLDPMTIEQTDYNAGAVPAEGIPTVGTTAFLASRYDAPGELVQASLDALYMPPDIIAGLIPSDQAAEFQGLAFHPVARHYFEEVGTP